MISNDTIIFKLLVRACDIMLSYMISVISLLVFDVPSHMFCDIIIMLSYALHEIKPVNRECPEFLSWGTGDFHQKVPNVM